MLIGLTLVSPLRARSGYPTESNEATWVLRANLGKCQPPFFAPGWVSRECCVEKLYDPILEGIPQLEWNQARDRHQKVSS